MKRDFFGGSGSHGFDNILFEKSGSKLKRFFLFLVFRREIVDEFVWIWCVTP